MASVFYPKFKELALGLGCGSGSVPSGTLKIIGIDTDDYTYSATHNMLDDVAAGSRVGTATALASVTFTNGTLDSNDVVMSAVSGDEFEAVIIFLDTGVESTSPLVMFIDTGTGLPLTPNGDDVNVRPHANGYGTI